MNNTQRVEHYLSRYADSTLLGAAAKIERDCDRQYRQSLCVPLFDEPFDFVQALLKHPNISDTLVILVINAPENAGVNELIRTRALLQQVCSLAHNDTSMVKPNDFMPADNRPNRLPGQPLSKLSKIRVRMTHHWVDVLVLDCCSEGHTLPPSEGVGLARKLGNDIALFFWQQKRLQSPWLYQTDADALLPENYFAMPIVDNSTAAVHLNFEHIHPNGVSTAQRLYDLKLDYYLTGLCYASSPYAHYSLGSAMIVHANYYAIVRGYPRRSAGEDFYLLNKLAKEGSIAFDSSRLVHLRERASTRVPFGTGPGVAKFNEYADPIKAQAFYAPECYIALKQWLEFIESLAQSDAGNSQLSARGSFLNANPNSPVLVAALDQLNLFAWLERSLKRNASCRQAVRQLHLGMDALKTLQLIHALRDHGYANVDAETASAWMSQQSTLGRRSGDHRNRVFTIN